MDDEAPNPSARPIRTHALEYAWRTDRGRVRPANEDAVAVDPDLGLLLVADGVGGARGGEVASALAAHVICDHYRARRTTIEHLEDARVLAEAAIEKANLAVWLKSQSEPALAGMGTTVVVCCLAEDGLAFAYVGDSRLYRLRDGELQQLSRDHSFIQEVVDQGFFRSREDARRYGIGENILTRAVGSAAQVIASSGTADLAPGDIVLLCTDGLSGLVPEDWLRQVLMASEGNRLDPAAEALVRLANERGGTDNITLALLRVGRAPA